MKKIILMAVMSVMTLTAAAQNLFVGGSVAAWRNHDDKVTTITIAPEVGYNLNSNWVIGTVLGWTNIHRSEITGNLVDFDPYARYTFFKKGMVSSSLTVVSTLASVRCHTTARTAIQQ